MTGTKVHAMYQQNWTNRPDDRCVMTDITSPQAAYRIICALSNVEWRPFAGCGFIAQTPCICEHGCEIYRDRLAGRIR